MDPQQPILLHLRLRLCLRLSISTASWLSISLPNPFKSLEEEEEEEGEEDNENKKIVATKADEESEEGEEGIGNGVREDLLELTKTIGHQIWGVASFLAPPPSPPPGPVRPVAEEPQPPSSASSLALLGGIQSDFAEIGDSFKTGLSRLTTNKTVNEISRFASSLLQLDLTTRDPRLLWVSQRSIGLCHWPVGPP